MYQPIVNLYALRDDLTIDWPERYERSFDPTKHPRHEAGTGKGGQFKSRDHDSSLRVKDSHPLALKHQGSKWKGVALDWHYRANDAVRKFQQAKQAYKMAGVPVDEAKLWNENVKTDDIRKLLEEMNQLNRDAAREGINLAGIVNANQLIPKEISDRLAHGRKFFDQRAIRRAGDEEHWTGGRDAPKEEPKQTPLNAGEWEAVKNFKAGERGERKEMLKDDFIRAAVEKSMGLSPSKPQPQAAPQPAPPSPPADPLASLNPQARGRVQRLVADELPDDPGKRGEFTRALLEAWELSRSQAERHNTAMREITGQFGGGDQQMLAARVAKGWDVTKLPKFDQLVDFAANHFPDVISHAGGESGTGSFEEGLVAAIRKGMQPVPQPWHDEVVSKAIEMLGGDRFFDPDDADVQEALASTADNWQDDPVPFSGRSDVARLVARYWARDAIVTRITQALSEKS